MHRHGKGILQFMHHGDRSCHNGADNLLSPGRASCSSGRNLWVSGLSSSTRAADLKSLFSKHGKVIGAKVVTNARSPGARCYGFVTMSTSDEATKCISHLHRTELHGRMISVEKAKNEPSEKKSSDRRACDQKEKVPGPDRPHPVKIKTEKYSDVAALFFGDPVPLYTPLPSW